MDVHLITKTNRAGYPFYSAFIKIKDNWWGEAADVTHILRMTSQDDIAPHKQPRALLAATRQSPGY